MTKTYFIADDNGTIYAHDIDSLAKAESTLSDILTAHPEYEDLGLEVLTDGDDEQTPVYFIEDLAKGDIYYDELKATNEADALKEAWDRWYSLSAYEQKKCGFFRLCYGDPDDLDCGWDVVLDITKAHKEFEAAVNYMDDDLREEIHADFFYNNDTEFLEEYKRRHREKFGEEFTI